MTDNTGFEELRRECQDEQKGRVEGLERLYRGASLPSNSKAKPIKKSHT